jgi:hypothetical protein
LNKKLCQKNLKKFKAIQKLSLCSLHTFGAIVSAEVASNMHNNGIIVITKHFFARGIISQHNISSICEVEIPPRFMFLYFPACLSYANVITTRAKWVVELPRYFSHRSPPALAIYGKCYCWRQMRP